MKWNEKNKVLIPYRKCRVKTCFFLTGFTLVELLIAISITAIIMGITYACYFNTVRTTEQCRETLKPYKIASILFSKINEDIRGCYNSQNKHQPFLGRENSLKFVSTHSLGLSKSNKYGLHRIEYFALPQGDKRFNICRKEDGVKFCMGGYFKSLQFSYYDGHKWVKKWDSNWRGRLPQGVKVNISIEGKDNQFQTFSSLFVIPCAP